MVVKLHQKVCNTRFHCTQSSKQTIQHNELLPPEVLMEKLQNIPAVSTHLCSHTVVSDRDEDADLPQTEVLAQRLQNMPEFFRTSVLQSFDKLYS
jgi:hypothetical protein